MDKYTVHKYRTNLGRQMRQAVLYWSSIKDITEEERCTKLMEAMANILDGKWHGVPALELVISPGKNDDPYIDDLGLVIANGNISEIWEEFQNFEFPTDQWDYVWPEKRDK